MRAIVRIHDYISGSSKSYAAGRRKTKEQTAKEQREEAKREESSGIMPSEVENQSEDAQ